MAPPPKRGWRRLLSALGRIALWTLLLLGAVELSLRAAGWYLLRSRARAVEQKLPAGAYRMLFIGESTTYGLSVEPREAYPAKVAELLGARHPDRKFLAINRGVPSLTSTAMLRTLPEKLRLLSPPIVLILAGANDFHTQYNGVRIPGEGWLPRPVGEAVGNLRVFRLIDLAIELRNPKVEAAEGQWLDERGPRGLKLEQKELYYDLGSGHHLLYDPRPGEEALVGALTDKLEANLERMIEQCRAAGAKVVLIGYLVSPAENRILERLANRLGVPFVPTWLGPADPGPRGAGLIQRDGFHPTVEGHRVMAERVADAVDRLLDPPAPAAAAP